AWATLTAGTSILKIGLSFLFITWLGIWGAAYSALLSAILLFVLASIGGQRRYAIKYRRGANMLIFVFAAIVFISTELGSDKLMQIAQSCASAFSDWLLGQNFTLFAMHGAGSSFQTKLPYIIDATFRALIAGSMILVLPLAHTSARRWVMEKLPINLSAS